MAVVSFVYKSFSISDDCMRFIGRNEQIKQISTVDIPRWVSATYNYQYGVDGTDVLWRLVCADIIFATSNDLEPRPIPVQGSSVQNMSDLMAWVEMVENTNDPTAESGVDVVESDLRHEFNSNVVAFGSEEFDYYLAAFAAMILGVHNEPDGQGTSTNPQPGPVEAYLGDARQAREKADDQPSLIPTIVMEQ